MANVPAVHKPQPYFTPTIHDVRGLIGGLARHDALSCYRVLREIAFNPHLQPQIRSKAALALLDFALTLEDHPNLYTQPFPSTPFQTTYDPPPPPETPVKDE